MAPALDKLFYIQSIFVLLAFTFEVVLFSFNFGDMYFVPGTLQELTYRFAAWSIKPLHSCSSLVDDNRVLILNFLKV